MTQRPQQLSSTAGTLILGSASGVYLSRKIAGFGLPPVKPQWSEGAGNGRRWRGSRVLARALPLRFNIRGTDRADILTKFSRLAQIIAPTAGLTRLQVNIAGASWWVDMTRTGGGDYAWDTDTDGETFLTVPIAFETEEPYWTRLDASSRIFTPSDVSDGLLTGPGSMVGMELSSTTSLGSVVISNEGDVGTPALVVFRGPFSGFQAIGAAGELVAFVGTKLLGESVTVDMALGTAVDDAGVNVYDGLNDVPRFWELRPGDSTVTLQVDDADAGSAAEVYWNPRRWVMF